MTKKPLSSEYQYLLDSRWLFVPKSKQAAFVGVDGGFLPEAALVHRGVNVRPIFEEPYDLLELEKVLAKPDLSLETVELLMKIFGLMTKNPDQEVALFAAESINALEIRCGRVVQALRAAFGRTRAVDDGRRLFEALYGVGVVNANRPVLKAFYMKEALLVLDELGTFGEPDVADLPLAVQVHLDLDQAPEAEALVQRAIERDPHDHHLYFLMARIHFFRGDYLRVMAVLLFLKGNARLPEVDAVYRFWVGGDHG